MKLNRPARRATLVVHVSASAGWLLLPAALLTLLSGLLLALGTPWGLARHRWVCTKFWLTLATTAATAFALRPVVNAAVTAATGGEALPDPGDVLFGPIVSLSAYLFMTAVSILKPWGPTRRGRKQREAARGAAENRRVRQAV
ncbi:DUF2269 domain-containing protein [Streptomyces sp. NPDC051207]|uniref:DUF2269 domain-containing protein n=1 Tax=Streptomyces sp. NPDC051207 TaxID=3154641 RepID=UPI00342B10B1